MGVRERIIKTFLELLGTTSYEHISIAAVMRQCQLPRTYYYNSSMISLVSLMRPSIPLWHPPLNG